MKVMQINCVYKKGSTGKIVYDIHTEIKKQGMESVVCYGRGAKVTEEGVYKTSSEVLAKFNNVKSKFTGIPYNGSFFATNKLLRIIKKEKPDVVHLHCINGFFVNIYRLVNFLKKNQIPTVMTHHAEFMFTGNCGHSYSCENWKNGCGNCPDVKKAIYSYLFDFTKYNFNKMKKAFEGFESLYATSVSPWLENRSLMSPIFKEVKHTTVMNGLDTDIFNPHKEAGELRKKHGISDTQKVLIHVTASFESKVKGGNYIIELAKKLGNDYKIIVIGNREIPIDLPENIIAVGRVENQVVLAKYYTMADLCVVTGLRETFSMPVAEAMCCGTPAVGFLAGGPESITIDEYSKFVEYGNIDELVKAVKECVCFKQYSQEISRKAIEKYNKQSMCNDYINVYKEVLRNE